MRMNDLTIQVKWQIISMDKNKNQLYAIEKKLSIHKGREQDMP